MGKKSANSRPAVSAKHAAKPAAVKASASAAKPPKAAAGPKRGAKSQPAKAPAFTADDVALRAYFIAEKRRMNGLPGDERHDWLEAERQLCAENGSSKGARRTKVAAN